MKATLAKHEQGGSMRQASSRHGIPYLTFREWCYSGCRSKKRGGNSVLTKEEEEEVVQYVLAMCDRGLGLSPLTLKMNVADITRNCSTPFWNGIPGDGWFRWFRKHHPELTLRVALPLSSSRAKGLCKENVGSFYGNLSELYSLHGYPPKRVWNCDESGV